MISWKHLLTPFASICTMFIEEHSKRTYLSYYIFGVRVAHLHLNR